LRLNPQQVEVYVDFESKTDQTGVGNWFALAKTADDEQLDPYLMFCKYKQILEKKDKNLTKGRLWIRIDQNKDGDAKVTKQVRGKEWLSEVPKKVANWLNLPEADKYTGHCFRRTCAQWAADAGVTETQMQHHFGWKSSAMVMRYSRSSASLKQTMAANLDIEKRGNGMTSNEAEERQRQKEKRQSSPRKIAQKNNSNGKKQHDGQSDEKRRLDDSSESDITELPDEREQPIGKY
jgi:hypothetical protein